MGAGTAALRAPRPAGVRPRLRVLGRRGGDAAGRRHRPGGRRPQRRRPGGHPPRPRAARRRPRALPGRPGLPAEHRGEHAGSPTRSPRRHPAPAPIAAGWWSPGATHPPSCARASLPRMSRSGPPWPTWERCSPSRRRPRAPVERGRHAAQDPRGLRRRPSRGLHAGSEPRASEAEHGRHLLIADTPQEIADAVAGLLADPARRQALAGDGPPPRRGALRLGRHRRRHGRRPRGAGDRRPLPGPRRGDGRPAESAA